MILLNSSVIEHIDSQTEVIIFSEDCNNPLLYQLTVIYYFLFQLLAVPLFHACLAENPKVCNIEHSDHSDREERQVISQNKVNECHSFVIHRLQFTLAFTTNVILGLDHTSWLTRWHSQVHEYFVRWGKVTYG